MLIDPLSAPVYGSLERIALRLTRCAPGKTTEEVNRNLERLHVYRERLEKHGNDGAYSFSFDMLLLRSVLMDLRVLIAELWAIETILERACGVSMKYVMAADVCSNSNQTKGA